jgi:hypothetical protein
MAMKQRKASVDYPRLCAFAFKSSAFIRSFSLKKTNLKPGEFHLPA